MKPIITFCLLLICISTFHNNRAFSFGNIFVNPNPSFGNDNNSGSMQFPLRTLYKAGQLNYNNNDTIFIRGGTYTAFKDSIQRFNNNGRIIIMPFYGETVVMDGQGFPFQFFWQAVLFVESSSNIDIRNLEVKNNFLGSGIMVASNASVSRFINIYNCKVHGTQTQGILIQGKNCIVDGCEIYDAVKSNTGGSVNGGWAGALCTYPYPLSLPYCDSVTFRNNYVHNAWGEGIIMIRGNNFLIENNRVEDCFSAYIYSDNSHDGIIRNNWIYSNGNQYNKVYPDGYSAPAVGIFWAAEGGGEYEVDRIVDNIDIYNNLIYRTGSAFGWFDDDYNNFANDSYKNIRIFYNTVYDTRGYQSFYIEETTNPIRVPPTGCKFMNNIICKAKYSTGADTSFRTYFTDSPDFSNAWEIKNNCFIQGYPTGFSNNGNIQGAPRFVDSTHNNPSYFKILQGSNCINSGISIPGISRDYFYNLRSNPPTIGFYEYLIGAGVYENGIINSFSLHQNYPNPFNPTTNIKYSLSKPGFVSLKIYDVVGKMVRELVNGSKETGNYTITFDGSQLASGVYFYKLEANNFIETKRMVLAK